MEVLLLAVRKDVAERARLDEGQRRADLLDLDEDVVVVDANIIERGKDLARLLDAALESAVGGKRVSR